ncbi:MAG: amidohydrolase [Firmicutes bacterium]|nr:amidohydrolase [Bacillota bacterium]MDD4707156.1 amidohydrolase [Bacillota bacterium]
MILIKGGNIYTMDKGVLEGGFVLIKDGRIADVGRGEPAGRYEDLERVIDASGMYVMPGFVDAHCHIGLFEEGIGFEGEDGNEMTDPITPHLRAIDAINPMDKAFGEAVQGGVTTAVTGPGSANVLGGEFVALKTVGSSVEDMIIKNPVAIKCAFGENPKRVYYEKKKAPMTRMATAALLREALMKAKRYMERLERVRDNDKGPELDVKMEALIRVLKKELPLKAHAHRADDILTALRIAREFDIDMTIDHCTEGHRIAETLVREGRGVVVGPGLTSRSKYELKDLTFKTPGILSEAGLDIAIMTDHPVVPIQYLSVCAALAVREGMDEYRALEAITINAARIIGIDDRVGSLTPGKDADVVVFEGHPFNYTTRTRYVIVNGKVVYSGQ